MKHIIPIVIFVALFSCESNSDEIENKTISIDNDETLFIGEFIDGPANVREKENGKVIFSINDSTSIEVGVEKNSWHQIGLWVAINKTQYEAGKILPNDQLFSRNRNIGRAIDTIELTAADENSAYIMGYTHSDNIRHKNFPEFYLSSMINKGETSKDKLSPFIKAVKFEEDDFFEKSSYEGYFIYEPFIDDPSPMDRIYLLFRNNILVGVIHSKPMQIEKPKSIKLDRGRTFTTFGNSLTDSQIKQIVEERNYFYNHVD